jgi:hypothetical protein
MQRVNDLLPGPPWLSGIQLTVASCSAGTGNVPETRRPPREPEQRRALARQAISDARWQARAAPSP